MRSEEHDTDQLPSKFLYVLCPEGLVSFVRQALARQSHLRWEQQRRIHVCVLPPSRCRDAPYVTSRINEFASRVDGYLSVIALTPVRFNDSDLRGDVGVRIGANSPASFSEWHLPKILKYLELDNISLTLRRFSNSWDHGEISRNTVERWIHQFDLAGNNRWIAERLLAVLDFWTSSRLIRALRISRDGLAGLSCVCVNSERLGASASTPATAVKKQLDALGIPLIELADIKSALESEAHGRILYLEDCLLSGNEMTRVLGGLLGYPDSFGKSRISALKDPSILKEKEILLRFGVVANGGHASIKRFLSRETLFNISVDPADETIETLTPDGIKAIENGTLTDANGCVMDPSVRVVRVAFRELDIWSSQERRAKAISFCSSIGRQLYAIYLARRGKTWPASLIEEAGLGVCGFALALAFSHSVPKSTLPIFWMRGRVTYKKVTIDWEPLFPNAI